VRRRLRGKDGEGDLTNEHINLFVIVTTVPVK
jgi:hypothetical protein